MLTLLNPLSAAAAALFSFFAFTGDGQTAGNSAPASCALKACDPGRSCDVGQCSCCCCGDQPCEECECCGSCGQDCRECCQPRG